MNIVKENPNNIKIIKTNFRVDQIIIERWQILACYDFLKASFKKNYGVNNEKTFLLLLLENFAMFNPKSIYANCICRIG